MRGRPAALLLCLAVLGCGRDPSDPSPPPTGGSSTTVVPTTRLPNLSGEPIPGLDAPAFHASLAKSGFSTTTPPGAPGFTTTTSKRADATVSTYGKGPADVVKVVAEAERAVAPAVLATVVNTVLKGAEATKAETWLKTELKKGPVSPEQPRAVEATYAAQPYELLVTTATATLSIGRLTT